MLHRFKSWLTSRKPKPLSELLAVEFDDAGGRVLGVEELDPEWNQEFTWDRVRRVCFKDGGMLSSDIVYLSLVHPEQVVAVPTEARGGAEFFGQICERGLLPEAIWRKAVGDTSGGLHCWLEGELPANRVARGFSPPAPTPPTVRVRSGRFNEMARSTKTNSPVPCTIAA